MEFHLDRDVDKSSSRWNFHVLASGKERAYHVLFTPNERDDKTLWVY